MLTDTEKRYSTNDRKLLTIHSAVKHFRHMLEGRQFKVLTDRKPLTFVFHKVNGNSSPRQCRHLEFISQFTTDNRYVSWEGNSVADALSRVSTIKVLNSIDYQGTLSPYVLLCFCESVFRTLHQLHHPGVKASVDLIRKRFIWKDLRRDVTMWTRACLDCQRSKVHRHTKSSLGTFSTSICNVFPLKLHYIRSSSTCNGYQYLLTVVDRFSRWPEAFPMTDQKTEAVAKTLFDSWISRFGVSEFITTDQGRNFDGHHFEEFTQFPGTYRTRTTAYHPQANGVVNKFHRQLKATIMFQATEKWTEVLPAILFGIRASYKENISASLAKMIFCSSLRLPGQCFREERPSVTKEDFLRQFRDRLSTDICYVSEKSKSVVHSLSKVSTIEVPNSIDYQGMAHSQAKDKELNFLKCDPKFEFKLLQTEPISPKLYCDISTGTLRPYVLLCFCESVFRTLHQLHHPGVKASVDVIRKRSIWKDLRRNFTKWIRACLDDQRSKVHRHTKCSLGAFSTSIRNVFPLKLQHTRCSSTCNGYLLTAVDGSPDDLKHFL
ncbi:uncharacterized protein LOC129959661 [Argiope bruennichi]|uniref:uncharacterized protein LOC129959661 n=1 Tax=Argiope bruennichi TaxID=94029 RepID=UPI00249567FB|nr:uncharacterized protein LOC129959661 [Argiope bruennichi]